MLTVVVAIHLVVAFSMIGLILLQKTEGNASGGGFSASASMTSMMQPRSRSNPLSRATVVFGIMFFATSLGLALLSKQAGTAPSIFAAPVSADGATPKVNDIRTDAPETDAAPAAGGQETPAPSFGGTPTPAAPSAPVGAPAVPNN
jgi:preprotein translocase subunit SecG